ncbi:hypothetical protein GRJ2_002288500 [Grus japonensis]|uniref:Uncharacterized protein n=1 Tax=Grus japonensis TaxID=30415 RepID=A0ABC9XLM9_GRUJA
MGFGGEEQTQEEKSLLTKDKPLDEAAILIPNLLNSRENRTRVSLRQVLQVGGATDVFGGAERMPHADGHWLINTSVRLRRLMKLLTHRTAAIAAQQEYQRFVF